MLNDIRHVTQRAAVAATYIAVSATHSSLSLSRTVCVCESVLVCVSRSVIKRFFALIHDLCIQCSLRCRIRHSRRHREQTRCPLAQKSRKRVRVAPAAVCVDVSRRHWQQQLRLPQQPPRRGAGNVEQPAAGDPFLLSGGRAYFQCVCAECVCCVCVLRLLYLATNSVRQVEVGPLPSLFALPLLGFLKECWDPRTLYNL